MASCPSTTKAPPKRSAQYFKTSKRVFKMALGGLYKERKIIIGKDGIRLAD